MPQRSLSPRGPVIIETVLAIRMQGVGASRRIRLALKCFHGRRSRVGFNGRLRGFCWIISGGTGKKRRSVAAAVVIVVVIAVAHRGTALWRRVCASRCEKPRQRGSVTRLHGGICAVYRQSDRRLVVYERSRVVHWLRAGTWYDRVPDTRLAARKRQDPEGDSLEDLSVEWSPPTSRGERRQMRTRYTMYRTASNNNLVAMFGHRSIFYCDFFPPSGSKEGGCPATERGVSLQVYEAASSSWARYRSICDTVLVNTRRIWSDSKCENGN